MRRGQSYQRATEPENDPSLCVQTFRVGALGEPLLADERGDERKSGKWIGNASHGRTLRPTTDAQERELTQAPVLARAKG